MVKKVLFLTTALCLSACNGGGSSESKDSNGNCTQKFITDYNNVIYEVRNAQSTIDSNYTSTAQKIADLEVLEKACNKFLNTHSGVMCKAEVDYEVKDISADDLTPTCNKVSKALSDIRGSVSINSNKTSTAGSRSRMETSSQAESGSLDVSRIEKGRLEVNISNASRVQRALEESENGDYVFVDGHYGALSQFSTEIALGAVYCQILPNNKYANPYLYSGQILSVKSVLNNSSLNAIVGLKTSEISVGCIKLNNPTITLDEFRHALSGTLDINLKN